MIPLTFPVKDLPIKGEFVDFDCRSCTVTVHFFPGSNKVSDALFPSFMVAGSNPKSLRGLMDNNSTHFSDWMAGREVQRTA